MVPPPPFLTKCVAYAPWPSQFLVNDNLSAKAAEHGAWAAYVLAKGEPRPPLAAVRQLTLCARCQVVVVTRNAWRGSHTHQVAPLAPVLCEIFDKSASATKAAAGRALVEVAAERPGGQVRSSSGERGTPRRSHGACSHARRIQVVLDTGYVPRIVGLLQTQDQPLEVSV